VLKTEIFVTRPQCVNRKCVLGLSINLTEIFPIIIKTERDIIKV
jgi:hypothetical protein